jgi:D-3-phosphoglycerate dehydrogenase
VSFSNLMIVRLKTSTGELAVTGTLFGRTQLRLVEIDGIEVDAVLQGHLLVIRNDDTPGVVGRIGTKLGEHAINIARMNVGTKPGSGRAIMLIEIDANGGPEAILAALAKIEGVREARSITL